MNGFLSIGECMVELSPDGENLFRMGFAGDTFNTAWYARRLLPSDWSVGYLSAVGDDPTSQAMLRFMRDAGVETGAVRVCENRPVGLYMIQTQNGERSFSYWRGQSAARRLAADETWLRDHLEGQTAIWFSGITLAILSREDRAKLVTAIGEARARSALVFFDTNLRPALWEDRDAMQQGIMQGATVSDVVLPSFDEEQLLWGDAAPRDTIARYREAGSPGHIVVKNGAAPVHLWELQSQRITVHHGPEVSHIVDSTAAGDSFGAAFAASLLNGESAEQAVRKAMTLAAKVIGGRGALVRQIFEGEAS